MNETIIVFARDNIKKNIAICSNSAKLLFKRMYSHNNLEMELNDVVDNMSEQSLSWAMTQLQNTLKEKYLK